MALSTLVPLIILAAGFEAVFALHVNVERIGRYLQVFHEPDDGWEHVAMRFGQQFPATGPDPLFSRHFLLATSINFLPAALGGEKLELVLIGVLHVVFINRIRIARTYAATQRARDLERFEALRREQEQAPTRRNRTRKGHLRRRLLSAVSRHSDSKTRICCAITKL